MAEPETFEALERQIESVLASKSTDFFEMAATLGLDPKKDFAGADLSGVDLSGHDLSHANFTETNLQGADLSDSNLEGTNFTDANLSSSLFLAVIKATEERKSINFVGLVFVLTFVLTFVFAFVFDRALVSAFGLASTIALTSTPILKGLFLAHNHDLDNNRNLAHNLIHNLIRTLDRDLDNNLNRTPADEALYFANYLAHDLNRALADPRTGYIARDTASRLVFALARACDLARNLDHTSGLSPLIAISNKRIYTPDQIYYQYLGTTLKDTNLANIHWNKANLTGALIVNCQGLTPEEVISLKARGVIFGDTPGERLSVTSRFSVPR